MTVYVRKDEPLESAISHFKQKVKRSGILDEYKAQMSYKSAKEKEKRKEYKRMQKRTKKQK